MKKALPVIIIIAITAGAAWFFLQPREDEAEVIKLELDIIARQAEDTPTLKGIPLFSHIRSFKQYVTDDFQLHIEELNMTIPNKDEFIKKATQVAPMIPHFNSNLADYTITFNEDDSAKVEFTLIIDGQGKNSHYSESRHMQLTMVESGSWKISKARVIQPQLD